MPTRFRFDCAVLRVVPPLKPILKNYPHCPYTVCILYIIYLYEFIINIYITIIKTCITHSRYLHNLLDKGLILVTCRTKAQRLHPTQLLHHGSRPPFADFNATMTHEWHEASIFGREKSAPSSGV